MKTGCDTMHYVKVSIIVTHSLYHGYNTGPSKQCFKGMAGERIRRNYIELYTMGHVSN